MLGGDRIFVPELNPNVKSCLSLASLYKPVNDKQC